MDVNLTSEYKVELKVGRTIPLSYEVNWKKSNIKFEDRFDKYLDPNFFQHRVNKLFIIRNLRFSLLHLIFFPIYFVDSLV